MKGKRNVLKTAALAAVLVVPGLALGQNISVIVNGDPVIFPASDRDRSMDE